jgi:hypothetical protein
MNHILSNLGSFQLSFSNLSLILPMMVVGMIAMSEIPSKTRVGHYSFEAVGAVIGVALGIVALTAMAAV